MSAVIMAVVVVGVVVGVGVVVRRVVMGEVLGTTNGNMVHVFTTISTILNREESVVCLHI